MSTDATQGAVRPGLDAIEARWTADADGYWSLGTIHAREDILALLAYVRHLEAQWDELNGLRLDERNRVYTAERALAAKAAEIKETARLREENTTLAGQVADYRTTLRQTSSERTRMVERLANCLADHAHCDDHPETSPDPDCPFCGDRSTYLAYVNAGGRDFRDDPAVQGKAIPIERIPARWSSEVPDAD